MDVLGTNPTWGSALAQKVVTRAAFLGKAVAWRSEARRCCG